MKGVRVAVGMSGGVDSSVAAGLLLERGYTVFGLTMTIWDASLPLAQGRRSGCFGPGERENVEAARQCARRLGIAHHVIPLAREYRQSVLDPFREGYLRGETPNPCALCNPLIKFGALLRQARAAGLPFDWFATGHYVRAARDAPDGRMHLYRGADRGKDQSYFLARLDQAQLAQTLFPLGALRKEETRRLARERGWSDTEGKAESQDFFEGDDRALLFPPGSIEPGPIEDEQGRRLGTHRGIVHYTVGQRSGLGVAAGERVYVKEIRPDTRTLIVGREEELLAAECRVADPVWIAGAAPSAAPFRVATQLRYRHPGAPCLAEPQDDGTLHIRFDRPQRAIAPGQMAVFYDGDEVLGGGWVKRGLKDEG